MAKFYGSIGFAETNETSPGVWTPTLVERTYVGDILQSSKRWSNGDSSTNDNISINMTLSVMAEPYVAGNYSMAKYAVIDGVKWKITSVEVSRPRVIFKMGELYNG